MGSQPIEEDIQRYGELVKQASVETLHSRFYDAFEQSSHVTKKWIPLLCCQTAMALHFNIGTRTLISPKNYLAAVSI
jgi:hypothetical protein